MGKADGGAEPGHEAYGFFGVEDFPGQVGATAAAEVVAEGGAHVQDDALLDKEGGDMGAAYAFAPGFVQQFVHADTDAEVGKFVEDAGIALIAFAAHFGEASFEGIGLMGKPEAEDMHFAVFGAGGKFAAADEFDAAVAGGGFGFSEAGERIMIGEGHGGQTGGCGVPDELGRAVRAVRGLAVGMQIDEGHGGILLGYFIHFAGKWQGEDRLKCGRDAAMVAFHVLLNEDDMNMRTEELLRILACPRCHGELTAEMRGEEMRGLICAACEVAYPVREGIPVMLLEEAVPLERWRAEDAGA